MAAGGTRFYQFPMTAHKESTRPTFSERTTRCRIRSTRRTHYYWIPFGLNINAMWCS